MKLNIIFRICLIAICLMVTLPLEAQEGNKEKREAVEKATKPFSTNYFMKSNNSFLVLAVNVIEGKIVLDEKASLKEVGGKMPYQRGNFKISVLDSLGKSLGEFLMPDPLEARSCEPEGNHLDTVHDGLIYISLPNSLAINQLIFSREKKRISMLNISTLVKNLRIQGKEEN